MFGRADFSFSMTALSYTTKRFQYVYRFTVIFFIPSVCLLQDQHPTESIPLINMNVTMNGQTGHPNAMQITALIRGKTRNYFVYAESGKVKKKYYEAIALVDCPKKKNS